MYCIHVHIDDLWWLCCNIIFYICGISVGFPTNPMDNTGVAHILEHTALCGSRRYPVRDPFFKMLTRSLATFMNAFTGTWIYLDDLAICSLINFHSFIQLVTGQCIRFVHKMKRIIIIYFQYTWTLCFFHSYVWLISGRILNVHRDLLIDHNSTALAILSASSFLP